MMKNSEEELFDAETNALEMEIHTEEKMFKQSPKHIKSEMANIPFIFHKQEGLLLSIEEDMGDAKILVYEDGSCGLKIESTIFQLSTRFIGESVVIEHRGTVACNIGEIRFHVSSQIPSNSSSPVSRGSTDI